MFNLTSRGETASICSRFCGLPINDLPFAFALEKRTGVQIVCDFRLAVLLSRRDETKSDDGGVAVLLNANVFGRVRGLRVAWFRRRSRTHDRRR